MTWLVAHLSPMAPKSVYSQLVEGGHGAYVPKHKVEVTWKRGTKFAEKGEPLVPGYVFIRYTHRWTDVCKIEGLEILYLADEKGKKKHPYVLTDEDIREIEEWEPDKQPPAEGFAYGTRVKVISGPATGMLGKVERRKSGAYEVAFKVMIDGIVDERVLSIPEHALELAVPVRANSLGSSTAAKIA